MSPNISKCVGHVNTRPTVPAPLATQTRGDLGSCLSRDPCPYRAWRRTRLRSARPPARPQGGADTPRPRPPRAPRPLPPARLVCPCRLRVHGLDHLHSVCVLRQMLHPSVLSASLPCPGCRSPADCACAFTTCPSALGRLHLLPRPRRRHHHRRHGLRGPILSESPS